MNSNPIERQGDEVFDLRCFMSNWCDDFHTSFFETTFRMLYYCSTRNILMTQINFFYSLFGLPPDKHLKCCGDRTA